MVEGTIGQLGGAAANTPGDLKAVFEQVSRLQAQCLIQIYTHTDYCLFEQAQRSSKCLVALGIVGPNAKNTPLLSATEDPGLYSMRDLFGTVLESMSGMWFSDTETGELTAPSARIDSDLYKY
jgi:hypothetical protein